MALQIHNLHITTAAAKPKIKRRIFTISPELYGRTSWDIDQLGKMNVSSSGTWTITPQDNFTASIKTWGAGGSGRNGTPQGYPSGGAGGFSQGILQFQGGVPYVMVIGKGGDITSSSFGSGGGMRGGGGLSGIFSSSYTKNGAVIVAGGGGCAAYLPGYYSWHGGPGGGTAGGDSSGYTRFFGFGGTQTAGGAPAPAKDGESYAGTIGKPYPSIGSALQGGSSSAAHCGGGGGYYGGGMGIDFNSGGNGRGGGGGGSGYIHPTYIISGSTVGTSYGASQPPSSSDADRGGAGTPGMYLVGGGSGSNGKIVIF